MSKIKENNVIGIIGNKNRGKSYILGRLINEGKNINKISGFNITTFGISINFPSLEDYKNNTNIISLDIAGKENPVLNSNNCEEIFKDKNLKYNDMINILLNDQKICENILSDFIILKSNCLIVVIEQLSFIEQKMLKELIQNIENNNQKFHNLKKLLIIHNLMNLNTKKDVEFYIKNFLEKSLTFKLKKRPIFPVMPENLKNCNNIKYQEINPKLKDIDIYHFIFGNDQSPEIYNYYNISTIKGIQESFTIKIKKKFDIIKEFYETIKKECESSIYLSEKIKLNEYKPGDKFISSQDKIMIKQRNLETNQKGFSQFNSKEPFYHYYISHKNSDYFLDVQVEILDFNLTLDVETKSLNDNFDIKIIGTRDTGFNKVFKFKNGFNLELKDKKKIEILKDYDYKDFTINFSIPREFEYEEKYYLLFSNRKKIIIQQIKKDYKIKKNFKYGIYTLSFPLIIDQDKE